MKPRFVVLGRHGDGMLRDADLHQLPLSPHVVAVRFDGELYFANAAHFEDCMLNVAARFPQARQFLIVSEGINQLDATGDEVLRHLVERLRASGTTLAFSGLKKQALDVLRATGTIDTIGSENLFAQVEEALDALAGRVADPEFDRRAFPLLAVAAPH
jgi:SulP family sulfate permease